MLAFSVACYGCYCGLQMVVKAVQASNTVVSRVFTEGRGGCLRLDRVMDMLHALKCSNNTHMQTKTNSRNMHTKLTFEPCRTDS